MLKHLLLALATVFVSATSFAQQTNITYLSGTGSDNTVEWDFYCSDGRNSKKWTKIAVPSCWEQQRFGTYNYGRTKEEKAKEKGIYKHTFKAPTNFRKQVTYIVFEGSMTDTEVKINGKLAGPIHQGAFYRFEYDISKLLKAGNNTLEVTVSKWSANQSVNEAERLGDYWIFGGIFRPVYLKSVPKSHISHTATHAKANGEFMVNVEVANAPKGSSILVSIIEGNSVLHAKSFPVTGPVTTLNTLVPKVQAWNPEQPKLYDATFTLRNSKGKTLHEYTHKIGFRTVEVRLQDGIYVNGTKILMKGVNRHSFHPLTARTTSKALSISDVELLKSMNMNAVRMSHYPPDVHFLEVCDSLGLFVLDELGGWQKEYDTQVGKKLVKSMVRRDVNHPSIIIWDNGNEGGNNPDLDDEFAKYDPQNRPVIRPWAVFRGLDTQHYKDIECCTGSLFHGKNIFFPTEMLHGLFDGGGGAGLEDYWNKIKSNPLGAGGFIWALVDECISRTDKNGELDCQVDYAPDGIVGPFREKEGSYYTIRHLWAPIQISPTPLQMRNNGYLTVKNEFLYRSLKGIKIELAGMSLADLSVGRSPKYAPIELSTAPTKTDSIFIKKHLGKLPEVLLMRASHEDGTLINEWTWELSPREIQPLPFNRTTAKAVKKEMGNTITLSNDASLKVLIDSAKGTLTSIYYKGKLQPLSHGPRPLQDTAIKLTSVEQLPFGLKFNYKGMFNYVIYELVDQHLVINYKYTPGGEYNNLGVTFTLPYDSLTKVNMLARGPYRVWKNRMTGPTLGLHEKTPNNTLTGVSFIYPEFKGYYANFSEAEFFTPSGRIRIGTNTEDLFLGLYKVEESPTLWYKGDIFPERPTGDISFLHAIPPIGDKFLMARQFGPQGQKNVVTGYGKNANSMMGQLYFRFTNQSQ